MLKLFDQQTRRVLTVSDCLELTMAMGALTGVQHAIAIAWNQIWTDDYDLMSLLRIIAFGLLMSLLQNIKIFGLDMILRIFKAQPLYNFLSVVYHNLIIVTETRQHSNSYCGISSFKFQLQLILLLYSAQKNSRYYMELSHWTNRFSRTYIKKWVHSSFWEEDFMVEDDS